ncbi:MAG: FMNH2-dependent monooxygenase [Pseudonocardiales bacterium]|nr:FMNH2-dependent monooxygenase [Pseudonocardiales bacterium]
MPDRRFHMGWFMNFTPPVWDEPTSGDVGLSWPDGSFHIEMAQAMERAGFDYMMLEDSEMVPDMYGGNMEASMRYSNSAPKHDPLVLAAALAKHTERMGIIVTMSTSFYPPFILARAMATLDHMTHGRIGWNIVTSSEDRAAQNFGLDQLYDHAERYDRAEEFAETVFGLWDSWEPDAIVADRATGVYTDYKKVHVLDHDGTFFKVRGPLNMPAGPQGRPTICQAGSSERGREFAAKYAETILSVARGTEAMKAFRDDIRSRMPKYGRHPDELKVLFTVRPIMAHSEAAAREHVRQMLEPTPEKITAGLVGMSTITDIDFSTFDLDAPLPTDLETNGHKSSLAGFYSFGSTLREIAMTSLNRRIDQSLIGTPAQVAERMGEMMDEVGGDGFLMSGPLSREYIASITDGLAPELRKRGLIREDYAHKTLRDNLLAF